ncbi:MAG: hypothetical protein WBO29_18135 [Albidovulum sp.]
MIPPRPPLFLARQSYRRRRMTDAARLWPLLGAFFFMMPILWHPAETPEPDTAWGGLYLFVAWTGLIVGAFILSRILSRSDTSEDSDPPSDGNGPGAG